MVLIEDVEAHDCHKLFAEIVTDSLENVVLYERVLSIMHSMTGDDVYTVDDVFSALLDLSLILKKRIASAVLRENGTYN